MIDPEIFKQQMALIADRIGRPLAGPTQVEYHRQLSAQLSTQQFVAAATLVFNTWSADFRNWPSPAQIVELITPTAKPALSAAEMFEKVLSATNDGVSKPNEQRIKVQMLGAAAVRAFHAAGGMRDFRDVLEVNVPWLRKRFVEAYELACENADAERAATLALNDADTRVAQLIGSIAQAKTMPAPAKRIESRVAIDGDQIIRTAAHA
jgi:hypothetical protein